MKGPHFPITLPRHQVEKYGRSLNQVYLLAVQRSQESLGREFHLFPRPERHPKMSDPDDLYTFADGSRYDRFVSRTGTQCVTGIYFPQVFVSSRQEWALEMLAKFPEGFLLSGAIDIATAIVAYPNHVGMAKPLLVCSALTCDASRYSDLNFLYQPTFASFGGTALDFGVPAMGGGQGVFGGLLFIGQ